VHGSVKRKRLSSYSSKKKRKLSSCIVFSLVQRFFQIQRVFARISQ
jgi:hypothetical protein